MIQYRLAALSAYQQQMRELFDAANASLEQLRATMREAATAASALVERLNQEKPHVKVD